jgi:hypothetical protein
MIAIERLQRELIFLRCGPRPDSKSLGVGTVRFDGSTAKESQEVIEKMKEVLTVLDEFVIHEEREIWPDDAQLISILPPWFNQACALPMTELQSNALLIRRSKMTSIERRKSVEESQWSIDNWLHWMRPENRQWYWWDAAMEGYDSFYIAVEVDGWPFPWGSLRWLAKAAGAISLDSKDEV